MMWQQLGLVIGGLGLFLLAVRMITEGLTLAAGQALRRLLASWTQTIPRGIGAGLLFTALVQSSSAVTVATIGFVNAGLLTLTQAMGVVYGANIGTTMTGWLVAAVGFKIKVEAFALPMVGVGMLLRLSGPRERRGYLGEALAGFGLFFIGIDVLQSAFADVATRVDLSILAGSGWLGVLMGVGLGFAMTTLMQSSSAAIAVVLTAATGGVIPLSTAASMVVGANIGTTSTAGIAVIGATANAKRVASAHILFNVITGLVALAVLPVMLWVVQWVGHHLKVAGQPAVVLALFHTLFNLLGVVLLYPFTARLAAFLGRKFATQEERAGTPQFLDRTLTATPALARDALVLELDRIGGMLTKVVPDVLRWESSKVGAVDTACEAVRQLVRAVGEFVAQMQRTYVTREMAVQLPEVLRAAHRYAAAAEVAQQFKHHAGALTEAPGTLRTQLQAYRQALTDSIGAISSARAVQDDAGLERAMQQVEQAYQSAKRQVLQSGSEGELPIAVLYDVLEQVSRGRQLAELLIKAGRDLMQLDSTARSIKVDDTTAAPVSPELSVSRADAPVEP